MSDDEKKVFVTNDAAITGGKGKLHDVDRRAMNPEGGITITSVEQLQAMAQAAHETFVLFEAAIAYRMTPARAQRIRELRVDNGYSWRAVAAQCAEEWGADAGWAPPSNQIAGIALCERAAATLDEDGRAAPWN